MTDDIKAIRDALDDDELRELRTAADCAGLSQEFARLLDALEQAQAEVRRLEDLSHCGCGDQFTADEPGRCAICVMVKGSA